MNLLPVTNQLLTPSGGNPNIGTLNCAISHITSAHTNGEGENNDDRVSSGVGEPDVVLEFGKVFGHARMKMGARFSREGTAAGGSGPLEAKQ